MSNQKIIRFLKYAILVTALLIIYNTLIPFRIYLEPEKIVRNFGRINWTPFFRGGEFNSLTDIVGNVLLFMPFSFFLFLYYHYKNQRGNILLKTVFCGFLLSLIIECSQIFFHYRITAVTDLINNTFGSLLGAVAAAIYLRRLSTVFQKFLHEILESQPLTLFILIIIAVELFGSLLPFNVSITISDLKHNIAYTNIKPFGMEPLGLRFGAHIKNIGELRFSGSEFLGSSIFYLLYAYIVLYVWFQYWRGKRFDKLKLVILLGLYFPGLELIQFFIKSRFSDINDVISGYMGAAAGVVLFLAVKKQEWFVDHRRIDLSHFRAVIMIYFGYIFYKGLLPFNFSLDADVLDMDFRLRNLIPFYSYYKVTSLWNIYDMFEGFFLTMPLGMILAVRSKDRLHDKSVTVQALSAGLTIGLIIELGQLFLRTRTGEITDVILNVLGAFCGLLLYRYYHENYMQQSGFIESLKTNAFDPDFSF